MWSEPASRGPLVVAHRGASAYEPENTLRAIRKALALRAPAVEVDVRRSKDGALVVLHDETVNRTTDGTGSVGSLTLEELRALDVGMGERIPTLTEVFGTVRGKASLVLELKERGLWQPVVQLARGRLDLGDLIVVSFHRSEIAELKTAHPDLRAGALSVGDSSDALSWAVGARADLAGFRHEATTADLADRLHQSGRRLLVWTVNDPGRAKEVAVLGADLIVSDAPDVILEAVEST